MTTHRQSAYVLACLLACVGWGREPAPANATPEPVVGKPWTVPELDLELVFVEAGSFMMGSDHRHADGQPIHEVRVTRPFWIGKYEVTQREYEALAGRNPSFFQKGRVLGRERRASWLWQKMFGSHEIRFAEDTSDFPAELLSWADAVAFCRKLTDRERQGGRLPDGYEFRLPTEAEWEYAAKGGADGRATRFSGSDDADDVAWYDSNSGGRTHEVGGKKPNELGLYDMSGNVWEWCLDWYDDGYYAKSPPADPRGPATGQGRAFRGGAMENAAFRCCVASRFGIVPTGASYFLGLRVVLAPAIAPASR